MKTYLLSIEVDQEDDGRWNAACPILPGCNTWGNTREEAIAYLQDAIRLYIEDLRANNEPLPDGLLVLESPAVSVMV
jgi:antitoxin HicB